LLLLVIVMVIVNILIVISWYFNVTENTKETPAALTELCNFYMSQYEWYKKYGDWQLIIWMSQQSLVWKFWIDKRYGRNVSPCPPATNQHSTPHCVQWITCQFTFWRVSISAVTILDWIKMNCVRIQRNVSVRCLMCYL
jgi:hypothetical protein